MLDKTRINTPQVPPERVVLIPCSAGSARQWKALTEQLADFQSKPLDLSATVLKGAGMALAR